VVVRLLASCAPHAKEISYKMTFEKQMIVSDLSKKLSDVPLQL
jgi:hypothetical protein